MQKKIIKPYNIVIIFIFLSFVSCITFSHQSERILKRELSNGDFDVIIVPGVPFNKPNWDKVMKLRVYWAYYLYNKHITKNIIFSGSAVYTPYIESKIMRLYAIKLGIDSNNIFIEQKAEHSTENIYFSVKIADSLKFKRIAFASDPYQTELLKHFIRKKIPKLHCLPASIRIVDSIPKINPQINFKQAFVKNFISIKKRQTKKERIRGTFGKNIDYDK